MKILFSGYHNPHFHTITEYIESAIRKLGHVLFIFEDRQHIIPGRMRHRIQWLDQFDIQHINRKMVSLTLKTKPGIVIVAGGHRITGRTVKTLKDNGIVTVLWTIDAPLNIQPIIDVAPLYDHIFCQGTEAVELLNHAGINGAQWLPVACDPSQHRPVELSAKEQKHYGNEVVFVGSYYPNRAELFEKIRNFDLGIWGPGWEKLEKRSCLRTHIKTSHTSPSEWLKIYSASKIVLAPHYKDPQNKFPVYQASPRVFEALACQSFVLVDKQRDVFSLFDDGKHLVSFASSEVLIDKIQYYLANPIERNKIANQGYQEVLEKHTYKHRINEMLTIMNN